SAMEGPSKGERPRLACLEREQTFRREPDLRFRSDLLRQLERQIVAARRVGDVFAPHVDVANQPQALDLPPGVLTPREVAEGCHREVLRAIVVTGEAESRCEVEPRDRVELGILLVARE